jgi:hypothetical protein
MISITQANLLAYLLAPSVSLRQKGVRIGLVAGLLRAQISGILWGAAVPSLSPGEAHVIRVLGFERAPAARTLERWILAAERDDIERIARVRPPKRPRCRCCGQWLPGVAP